ncbi:MAG: murein L,D-transpeptidase catalytic domain family protein [Bdellovibrionota bacterium]
MKKSFFIFTLFLYSAPMPNAKETKGGYSFADFSSKGAFETTRDQITIAIKAYKKKGAEALVARFPFLTQEDKTTLLKSFSKASQDLQFETKTDSLLFEGQVFSYDEKNFLINGKAFEYNPKLSLAENSLLVDSYLKVKTSWIQNLLEKINFIPQLVASVNFGHTPSVLGAHAASVYGHNRNRPSGGSIPERRATRGAHVGPYTGRIGTARSYVPTDIPGAAQSAYNQPTEHGLSEGLQAAQSHSGSYTNQDYMVLVDYANCRNQNSFFIVDLKTGKAIKSYRIPPAYGGDDATKTCTTQCSDDIGTGTHEAGAMVTTGEWGPGSKTGEGILLKGLEPKNEKTEEREIKIHVGDYKDTGNSAGCYVLAQSEIDEVKPYIPPGTFVYAANCPQVI